MTKIFLLSFIFSYSLISSAQEIVNSKDWRADYVNLSEFSQMACVASTEVPNADQTATSQLMVVKLQNSDGTFSAPFVYSLSANPASTHLQASAKTDKGNQFSWVLMQNPNTIGNGSIARFADNDAIIRDLRAHNRVTVKLLDASKNLLEETVFSLRGSSKVISTMISSSKCN